MHSITGICKTLGTILALSRHTACVRLTNKWPSNQNDRFQRSWEELATTLPSVQLHNPLQACTVTFDLRIHKIFHY